MDDTPRVRVNSQFFEFKPDIKYYASSDILCEVNQNTNALGSFDDVKWYTNDNQLLYLGSFNYELKNTKYNLYRFTNAFNQIELTDKIEKYKCCTNKNGNIVKCSKEISLVYFNCSSNLPTKPQTTSTTTFSTSATSGSNNPTTSVKTSNSITTQASSQSTSQTQGTTSNNPTTSVKTSNSITTQETTQSTSQEATTTSSKY